MVNDTDLSQEFADSRIPVPPPAEVTGQDDDEFSRDPVEILAAEFVDRHRLGESPGIEEYALQYPEHAKEIRDLFPMIAKLENLKLQRERSSGGVAATGLPSLKKLGDFRIIGEVGRGGMGIVYEAEQLSLRRLVALKVLGAQIANSVRQLKRFRREAEAAARLHHTNIVPIFAIGEEDSIHYYAMQYINGPTLAELIDHKAAKAGIRRQSAGKSQAPDDQSGSPENRDKVLVTETVIDQSSAETPPTQLPVVVEYQEPSGAGRLPKLFVGATHSGRHAAVYTSFHHEDWRSMARIGAQLADALAYAHDQGVLHRDIKPANILIDADGLSWLADFGLAKHEDHEGVTHSGDIVGTLRFMAPEQFHGKCDARSDLYSLGLTLYEVLTLRPAFDETRYAPLLQQKTTQHPPSPRSLNPRIPLDLETIILKACATEPQHRYATARELRDDLRRFIDDLPIQARRLTLFEQLWRWARRNPVVASLSTATALLLMTLATVLAVGQYRAQKALIKIEEAKSRAEQNLQVADAEAERAAGNLKLALAALDRIFQNISSRGVPQSLNVELEGGESASLPFSTVTSADAILLEDMVQFFNKFAEQNATNLKGETAKAFVRIGDIQDRLGQPAAAETAYRKALQILLEQWSGMPQSVPLNLQIAAVWNDIGVASSIGGKTVEAINAHVAVRALLTELVSRSQDDDAKFALAQTNNLLNSAMVRSGATELISPPAGRPGEPPPEPGRRDNSERSVAGDRNSDNNRARRPGDGGRNSRSRGFPFDGQEAFSSAVGLLRELIQKHPDRPEYRLALARSFRNRSRMPDWHDQEAIHEAEYAGLESIEIMEQLVAQDSKSVSYQYELADTYCLVAQHLREFPLEYRFQWLHEAVAIAESLETSYPFVPEYQALKASGYRGLAKLEFEDGQLDQANGHFTLAAALQQQLMQRFPSIRLYLFSNAQTLAEWAALEFDRGNKNLAEEKLYAAIAAIEKSLKPGGENLGHQMFLRRLQTDLAYYRGDHPPPPVEQFGPGNGTSRPPRGDFRGSGPGPGRRRPAPPPNVNNPADHLPDK